MISRPRMIEIFKDLQAEENKILKTKGKEYSGDNNSLRNFIECGKELDLSKEEVLWVFLKKHMDAILSYIKQGKTLSDESIWGRILDARVYLGILACMTMSKDDDV